MNTKEIGIRLKTNISTPIYIEDYSVTDSKNLAFVPSLTFSASPILEFVQGITITPVITLSAEFPSVQEIVTTACIITSAGDSSGRSNPVAFSASDTYLYIGNDGASLTASRKTWIPFSASFVTNGSGVHIVSAELVLTSANTQSLIDKQPCIIKIGCSNLPNSASPTSWSTSTVTGRNLNGKSYKNQASAYTGSLVETWVEGEQYSFDITNTIKDLMGAVKGAQAGITGTVTSTCAVTWDASGSIVGILITDKGSSAGSYRAIISSEGSEDTLPAPELRISYANNTFTDTVQDTFLSGVSTAEKRKVNYSNPRIYVGESTDTTATGAYWRGLIKFDTAIIPDDASVTSASLCLYLLGNKASATAYLTAFKMLTYWDSYGASWNTRTGIESWNTVGCSGAGIDYESSYSGSISLVKAPALGFKIIDCTDLIGDLVTNPINNKGILLKMTSDGSAEAANSAHYFASSEFTTGSCRPKLMIEYTVSGTPYTKTIQNI